MDATTPKENVHSQTDRYPLLMERVGSCNGQEHIIDMRRNDDASSSSSHDDVHVNHGIEPSEQEDGPSSSTQGNQERTSNRSNFGNSSIARRGDNYGHARRSPLNSGLWITVELVITVGQIVASIVVLSLARHEKPQAPLFAWVVGYASGCFATLPILYWRYRNRNQNTEQVSGQSRQESSQNTHPEPTAYTAISDTQAVDEENQHTTETASRNSPTGTSLNSRINGFVDHLKMALDCFFAVWFVVGNVWIFGGQTSPSDAPKLYRLCIVFLTFSCIGYAMPFILCATICCCLPCIISILGFREDFSQNRGASSESISALPTYKFKAKQNSADDDAVDSDSLGRSDGGILAAGTEKERVISGEDAVCCICLAKYVDNEELKELPCRHIFHVECIDKWLKINALCPLCKAEIGEDAVNPAQAARDTP